MRSLVIAALAGVVFAVGLALSGMTDPGKVEAFLDVGGGWDPALAFVMGGAIGVHALAYVAQRGLAGPLGHPPGWTLAPGHGIDGRLVGGAALFGAGWGLSGWCPGPALVSLPTLGAPIFVFVGTMLVGLGLGGLLSGRSLPSVDAATEADVCG